MGTRTKYEHGEFSWAELAAHDLAREKAFYTGVLGWEYDDVAAGPRGSYSMAKAHDAHAAGLYALSEEMLRVPVSPHWLSYFAVADVEAAAACALSNGGRVLKEPFEVLDVGRMSVIADCEGAMFALWQARRQVGSVLHAEPGGMCWTELHADDLERAQRFYEALLGWRSERMDLGGEAYTVFKVGERSVAGMLALAKERPVPAHWLVYFTAASALIAIEKVCLLGGHVQVGPLEVANVGRIAIFTDPEGVGFGLVQPASTG
jgi:uncharacterized protein